MTSEREPYWADITADSYSCRVEPSLGSPHLTTAHAPELARCIAQSKRGQAGWAGWYAPAGKTCSGCKHFEKERPRKGLLRTAQGRCAKNRQLHKSQGPKFPAETPACRYFDEARR
jgi:hypothetical protein